MARWFGDESYQRVIDIFGREGHSSYSHALMPRSVSRRLVRDFSGDSGQNTNTSQYFLGYGWIHYALIRNARPRNILCIGSRMGFVPAILAMACRDNRFGHVDFVDASYDEHQPDKHWSGIGFWNKVEPKTHFAKIGVEEYVQTFIMTTGQYAERIGKKRFQYIYIDGDHSYAGVKNDYQLFFPRLDQGGFMVFHDISARGYLDKGHFGVWKLWKEVRGNHSIELPTPLSSGLGILQKSTP